MIKQYRKKPVIISAVQWTGYNLDEIAEFMPGPILGRAFDASILINTLEGEMEAKPSDYIIKGIKGEFYPCKPDIFEASYEEVK